MKNYPYIQRQFSSGGINQKVKCDECGELHGPCVGIEWRVDCFQGNCEIERLCKGCFEKKYPEIQLPNFLLGQQLK